MELLVERDQSGARSTLGKMYRDERVFICYTLEDPIREKKGIPVEQWKIKGETAIPEGRYRVILSHSDRFSEQPFYRALGGRVPEVLGVLGFQGIRIHVLNWAKQTEGCLGVGLKRLPDMILESREAYKEVLRMLEAAERREDPVWITYRNPSQN